MSKKDLIEDNMGFPDEAPVQMMVAVPQQQVIRPAFSVQKLEGTFTSYVHAFDKENNKIVRKAVEKPAGYLVRFARGHSIRCLDEAHLRDIGAHLRMIPMVNTETGDVSGYVPNTVAA